ncbi:MAG: RNA methyltransferase [Deltaproteobacteria bacterium]|uniref:RNA methyltransferase n=1 Tax=Desulfobacula sp. TaxID=2593537 RepID=UPI00199040A5|nr:RNA methyltransferase [Candidatus Desulfobacula maris]MBL6993225.1 RNA methyltransferase [Desulfobacula sp.]
MDTFGFTKKKLLLLCPETQNKHIISWLAGFYQKLTTNRVNPASLDLFTRQYNEVLNWTGMNEFIRPESNTTRLWIESISDRIHFHRSAIGTPVRDTDLLETIQTDDALLSCHQPVLNCHLALDGLRSLFNVGSIFRTCDAAGFKSIILGNTPGKEHPRVQKTAMGAHQWVEQDKTGDLAQTLLEKKEEGFHIIGVETIQGALPFYDMPWEDNTILVFGNEEYGISSHVRSVCDNFVHIPMYGRKNSLNVANAAAVICFHLSRSLRSR